MNEWVVRMAWRDSRGSRRKMLLFVSSMVLGVAALVSINSFGDNLRRAIDSEAESLLGADLSFESRRPFSDEMETIIDSLGGRQSRRISFSSMAYFERTGSARLATVRAHKGKYPYYGEIETEPAGVSRSYLNGPNALVDGTLMQQFDVQIGDSVRIGRVSYRVAGKLVQTPRETAAIMLFSPRIYIPLEHMDETLLERGSRAEYEVYFRFDDGRDADAVADELRADLREARVSTDTVREERENWDQSLTNLYRFLGLVGFMALLLGSLGVASSIHVYVRQRIQTVAILRCFGSKTWSTFSVYLLQAVAMGVAGALMGSLLGFAVQAALPFVLGDFLPVEVEFSLSWGAVWLGSGVGLGVTVLFALLPLLTVKNVSPLLALRASVETGVDGQRSGLWWIVIAVIATGILFFSIIQSPTPAIGIAYALVLFVVFGLLSLVARLLIRILRSRFPSSLPYVWRQGIANLYRPNNQTLIMTLALGLGTFLIGTMLLTRQSLLKQVSLVTGDDQPNLVLFDIQTDQTERLEQLLSSSGLPVLDTVPIVSMRVAAVNDRTIASMRQDSTARLSWAHRREYRSTYRSHTTDSENLIDGDFIPRIDSSHVGPVPVTVEEDVANTLDIGIDDTVTFDIQGVTLDAVISGIRTVEWRRMQTNFFFVFPLGVLEDAPQFNVILSRTETASQSASVQAAVTRIFPNVSSIDISLVMNVFEAIFSRIAFIVRFMALFSILTGLIVLSGAVLISRFQRIEEGVLLKTLGASRAQVFKIVSVEYLMLGLLAAVTGLLLAIMAGWALARFVFLVEFVIPPVSVSIMVAAEIFLTVIIGLLNSRGIYVRPPLEVLRSEV